MVEAGSIESKRRPSQFGPQNRGHVEENRSKSLRLSVLTIQTHTKQYVKGNLLDDAPLSKGKSLTLFQSKWVSNKIKNTKQTTNKRPKSFPNGIFWYIYFLALPPDVSRLII